ncbi:MAG: GTP-binding protein [Anaerolineales bacterium]|nr:GTP-binding protein [Anaerolineales bacterium]
MNTIVQKKICLLGDFGVGKTSLIRRFVEGRFNEKYLTTIGVNISRKTIERSYGLMSMLIWDLAGSTGFDSFTNPSYMQGTAGAVIVCDITRRDTLIIMAEYARQARIINPKIHLVFVCNKTDLLDRRVISAEDLSDLSSTFGDGSYFLSSAKTGERVEDVFSSLAGKIDAGDR